MRHQNRIKKLGRGAAHRKATLAALSNALIRHKRITTTLPKAKALRSYVEPILNRAKEDTTSNRRQVFRRLQDKESVKAIFGEIAGLIGDRPGGYTRVVKLGTRHGDAAEMAIIELVDFNDVRPGGESGGRKRRTRRSRSKSSKSTTPKAETQQDDAKQEAPKQAKASTKAADKVTENPESEVQDQGGKGQPVPPAPEQSHPDTDTGTHPDAKQGATTQTGPPPPEAKQETQGRSEHRG